MTKWWRCLTVKKRFLLLGLISGVVGGLAVGAVALGAAPEPAVAVVVLLWCFVGLLGFTDRNREY